MTGDPAPPPPPPPRDGAASHGAAGSPADSAAGSPADQDDAAAARATARRIRELKEANGAHDERLADLEAQQRALADQIQRSGAQHADLAATVSETLAPQLTDLHELVTAELGPLRGDVDVLLAERTQQEKSKNAPVDWAALTAEQATEQWPILAGWVAEVLVSRYELTLDELPDCWALHAPVVAELSWLRTAYVSAYLARAGAQVAADWHLRWRPGVLARIRELIKSDECPPGRHTPRRGEVLIAPSQPGTLLRTQLAEPECWWWFYAQAVRADLAYRRARAAAGTLNWAPT